MENIYYVNFDLRIEDIKRYCSKDTSAAYKKIKQYMLQNGFEHIQKSGYKSKEKMIDTQMLDVLIEMKNKFGWLKFCIEDIRCSVESIDIDANYIFEVNSVKNINILNDINIEKETENYIAQRHR